MCARSVKFPKSLALCLERFDLRAEPSPNGERYKLVCITTGMKVGFGNYIWSRDEIEKIVEMYESREEACNGEEEKEDRIHKR
jgi:hypothetical protein